MVKKYSIYLALIPFFTRYVFIGFWIEDIYYLSKKQRPKHFSLLIPYLKERGF